jgi:Fe-S-cluster containining protein
MLKTESEHCQNCGACCAYFKVNCTPEENDFLKIHSVKKVIFFEKKYYLKGTEEFKHRCNFLDGKVGEKVFCTQYIHRPQSCRAFSILEYNKKGKAKINKRCTKARAFHHLPPIELKDVLIES